MEPKISSKTVSEMFPGNETRFITLLLNADRNAVEANAMAFVANLRDKYRKFEGRMFLSEKQLAWLKKLAGEA